MDEIEFEKYKEKGAYHWKRISSNPFISDCSVKARYNSCISILNRKFGSLKGKKVLDFGCGDGVLSYYLSKAGAEVYGIDLNECAIHLAKEMFHKKKLEAQFKVAPCSETGFDDESFDIVVSTEVIEHVTSPDDFLVEINRVLKKGGTALVTTPIRLSEKPFDRFHIQEWFQGEFEELNKKYFKNVTLLESHPVIFREFKNRHKLFKILLNLVSIFRNPFKASKPWMFNSIQYCLGTKGE